MSFCTATAPHTFFGRKKNGKVFVYSTFNIVYLTNDVVCFEQLGPVQQCIMQKTGCWLAGSTFWVCFGFQGHLR